MEQTHQAMLFILDAETQSATRLKTATLDDVTEYADTYTQSLLEPDTESLVLIDFSSPQWELSPNQQRDIMTYITKHTLNSTIYRFVNSIDECDYNNAEETLNTLCKLVELDKNN